MQRPSPRLSHALAGVSVCIGRDIPGAEDRSNLGIELGVEDTDVRTATPGCPVKVAP